VENPTRWPDGQHPSGSPHCKSAKKTAGCGDDQLACQQEARTPEYQRSFVKPQVRKYCFRRRFCCTAGAQSPMVRTTMLPRGEQPTTELSISYEFRCQVWAQVRPKAAILCETAFGSHVRCQKASLRAVRLQGRGRRQRAAPSRCPASWQPSRRRASSTPEGCVPATSPLSLEQRGVGFAPIGSTVTSSSMNATNVALGFRNPTVEERTIPRP